MSTIDYTDSSDFDYLQRWVGKEHLDRDAASVRHANLMAATIDHAGPLAEGDALPPLWHWLYFHEGLPASRLGVDGHAARGGFLPPVQLSNRLWAGGRLQFDAEIPLGATMDKRSQVLSVEHKRGASGEVVFVTVLHEIHVDGRRCVREEHDIAYKNPSPPGKDRPAAISADIPETSDTWTPDIVQLFRYSALTFNSNRVHYDIDYCRTVEGYDGIVIHGPLTATMLAGLATRVAKAPLRRFDYRARKPALLGQSLSLASRVEGSHARVWATLPEGQVVMEAQAQW